MELIEPTLNCYFKQVKYTDTKDGKFDPSISNSIF